MRLVAKKREWKFKLAIFLFFIVGLELVDPAFRRDPVKTIKLEIGNSIVKKLDLAGW